jgi:hypothetical protein
MHKIDYRTLVLRASVLIGLALVLTGCNNDAPTESSSAVTLKKAKVSDVKDYIKAQKGKVVVMDVWNFP